MEVEKGMQPARALSLTRGREKKRLEITNTQSVYSLIARMVLDLDKEMSAKKFFNVSFIVCIH